MKEFIITLIILAALVGAYFFIQSVRGDIVSGETQAKCDDLLTRTRFKDEASKDQFYKDCLAGKN